MPPALEKASRRISDNTMLTAVGRVASLVTPVLVTISMTVLGWYLAGQASAAQRQDARITVLEQSYAATASDVKVIQNTIQTKSQARDQQIQVLGAQVNSFDGKLDEISKGQAQLLAAVAAINARLDANERAAARN